MMWNRNQKRWAVTNLLSTAMIEDLSGKNLLVTRSKRKRIVEQEKECKDTDLEWQIFDMIVDEIHAVNFHESSIIRDYYEPCGWIFSHFIIHGEKAASSCYWPPIILSTVNLLSLAPLLLIIAGAQTTGFLSSMKSLHHYSKWREVNHGWRLNELGLEISRSWSRDSCR